MDNSFMVKSKRKMYAIPFDDIVFFESDVRKVRVHTYKGSLSYYGRFRDVKDLVDDRFMCCHKSYIINMDEIVYIEDGKITLNEMGEEVTIFLGRDSAKKALKCYEEYMKKRTKSLN